MAILKYTLSVILALFLVACGSTQQQVITYTPAPLTSKPKNIILMIGDGMGLSQVSAAMYTNKNPLNMEQFPVIGFHKSHSADDLITDSAAGATAFSCGIKTYNSAIGVRMDTTPCKTILEEAIERGYATGLIATATIVHATPAAFAAHESVRVDYEKIAADMANANVDLMIGGGLKYFDRREEDNRTLSRELREKGYNVEYYMERDIEQIDFNDNKKLVYFTADKQPLPVSAGRNYLSYASRFAPRFLERRSDKGFFMMIEGSQIDWGCHGRDGDFAIKETLDFDRAVGEILDYAKKTGNTLVIVTADHETGGMSIMPGSKRRRVKTAFTTNGHTASMVPVFAYGPGAERFSGIYENTEIYHKMRAAFGFSDSPVIQSDTGR